MRLNGKCLALHERLIDEAEDKLGYARRSNASFFSAMSDAINCMLLYLLNEEVSAFHDNRYPLDKIVRNAMSLDVRSGENEYWKRAYQDVQELFRDRINHITGSYFLDFTVSSYSVFEYWMCKFYDDVRVRYPSKNTKKKRLCSLIQKFNRSEDADREIILDEIMRRCGSFVSGSEKITFIISHLSSKYPRNPSDDINTVLNYAARRHTVHNLGVHIHDSLQPIERNGKRLELEKNKAALLNDYTLLIDQCEQLVEIYEAAVKDLEITRVELLFKH
jgi:hypothetical protein